MQKLYDIAAKTGEYTTQQGETKARWLNVGAILQGDSGPFMLLSRTFNPAGMPVDSRDQVLLSLFKPREDGRPGERPAPATPPAQAAADFDDDVPF